MFFKFLEIHSLTLKNEDWHGFSIWFAGICTNFLVPLFMDHGNKLNSHLDKKLSFHVSCREHVAHSCLTMYFFNTSKSVNTSSLFKTHIIKYVGISDSLTTSLPLDIGLHCPLVFALISYGLGSWWYGLRLYLETYVRPSE